MATTSPSSTEYEIPFTALTTPEGVKKCVFKSLTSIKGANLINLSVYYPMI